MLNLKYIESRVKSRLSHGRYAHARAVAEVAVMLAERWGADRHQAWLAGITHDYAREMPLADVLSLAGKHGLLGTVAEPSVALLHAPLGAVLLRDELGIDDPDVLRAVARHTTGAAGMTLLDKVLFVADYVEPGRTMPGVERVRRLAASDLDGAVLAVIEDTIAYLESSGKKVDRQSREARDELADKAGV